MTARKEAQRAIAKIYTTSDIPVKIEQDKDGFLVIPRKRK